MNFFQISSQPTKCETTSCVQQIELRKKLTMLTAFSMEVKFIQLCNNNELSVSSRVNVIITKPTRSLDYFPRFSKSAYEFIIDESIPPNTIARNVSILVQNEYQTDFSKGFGLELLNQDLTPANSEMFELVSNYGVGYLVVSIRVKSILDYESGKRRYDFIVKFN